MTLRIVLLLAVAAAGCGDGAELDSIVEPVWSWSYDAACLPPTDQQQDAVARGLALWDRWGEVSSTYTPEGRASVPHARVCFVVGEPRDGYTGWTSRNGDDGLIEVTATLVLPGSWPRLVAHEFGHLVIGGGQLHLPHDDMGILSRNGACAAHDDDGCTWSEADVEHLESFGLTHSAE